jgi:hypothetical protein
MRPRVPGGTGIPQPGTNYAASRKSSLVVERRRWRGLQHN